MISEISCIILILLELKMHVCILFLVINNINIFSIF